MHFHGSRGTSFMNHQAVIDLNTKCLHYFMNFVKFKTSESLGLPDSVNVQIHRQWDALRSGCVICFTISFSFFQHSYLLGWTNFVTHVTVLFWWETCLISRWKFKWAPWFILFKHNYERDMIKYLFIAKISFVSPSFWKLVLQNIFRESSFFSNDRSHTKFKWN